MIISQCNNTTLASSPSIWVGTSEAYQTSSSLIPNNSLSFVTTPYVYTPTEHEICIVYNSLVNICLACITCCAATCALTTGYNPDCNCSYPRLTQCISTNTQYVFESSHPNVQFTVYEDGVAVCNETFTSWDNNSSFVYEYCRGCTICITDKSNGYTYGCLYEGLVKTPSLAFGMRSSCCNYTTVSVRSCYDCFRAVENTSLIPCISLCVSLYPRTYYNFFVNGCFCLMQRCCGNPIVLFGSYEYECDCIPTYKECFRVSAECLFDFCRDCFDKCGNVCSYVILNLTY